MEIVKMFVQEAYRIYFKKKRRFKNFIIDTQDGIWYSNDEFLTGDLEVQAFIDSIQTDYV